MLKAYIDGSHNDEIEVVAGFVASELAWGGFDDLWRAILAKYGLHQFHTTDYWSRRRPYDKLTDTQHTDLRVELCEALKMTKAVAFGAVISKAAYNEWHLGQPVFSHTDAHYLGIDRSLRFLIRGINTHPIDEGVSIVCDNDQEHRKMTEQMQAWHTARLRKKTQRWPGHPDPNRPVQFSFDNAHGNPRLQAADIIANAGLRWGVSDLSGRFEEPQFLAGIKPDCPIALAPMTSSELIRIHVDAQKRMDDND
jgi:hypothetical protein